jgi:MFS family permease
VKPPAMTKRLRLWWTRLDPYVTRGVAKRYREGMKYFWWYGVFLAMSDAFVGSYITLFIFALGGTSLQVGTLASLASFFGMLMPIPGAQWAARWGRRKPVVLISFSLRHVALLAALLVPLLTRDPAAVLIVIGLFALRAAFLHLGNSPWTTFAGEIIPSEKRGRYFSSRKTVMALSSLIFVPLAGQLIGFLEDPVGYQISFGLAVVFAALALTLYGRIPEQKTLSSARTGSGGRGLRDLWQALRRNSVFWRFTLISMFFNFVWQLGGPYFGTYQIEVLGATSEIIGWLAMASALMRMVGQQLWGRAVDRRGARWAFTLCLIFIPFLPFIWLPLTAPWQVVFVYIPSGFLWAGRAVANFNLLLELAGEEQQTEVIASYSTLLALANILGPLVGGWIVTSYGYHLVFVLSGIGRMVAAVMFIMLLKPFDLKRFSFDRFRRSGVS